MGRTKSQCKRSVLSGLLAVVTVCALMGGSVGLFMVENVQVEAALIGNEESFSTQFTVGEEEEINTNYEQLQSLQQSNVEFLIIGVVAIIIVVSGVIGNLLTDIILHKDTIALLQSER